MASVWDKYIDGSPQALLLSFLKHDANINFFWDDFSQMNLPSEAVNLDYLLW
jgi:hypothetical protein